MLLLFEIAKVRTWDQQDSSRGPRSPIPPGTCGGSPPSATASASCNQRRDLVRADLAKVHLGLGGAAKPTRVTVDGADCMTRLVKIDTILIASDRQNSASLVIQDTAISHTPASSGSFSWSP